MAAVLSEAAVLPAVRGGAIAAMSAVMAARIGLALAAPAVAGCIVSRARARAERAAGSPALRAAAAAAAAAARRGIITRDGRIAAAHVFEFDPAGPQAPRRGKSSPGISEAGGSHTVAGAIICPGVLRCMHRRRI